MRSGGYHGLHSLDPGFIAGIRKILYCTYNRYRQGGCGDIE